MGRVGRCLVFRKSGIAGSIHPIGRAAQLREHRCPFEDADVELRLAAGVSLPGMPAAFLGTPLLADTRRRAEESASQESLRDRRIT
jgi:hypothetical protein